MTDEADSQVRARVGAVLNDKWTLERLLGAGGMGAVYAGRHRNGARAAVKVLHRSLSQHGDVRARFLREGYAANRVDRPGVVKVLDDDIVVGGPDDGTAYLVMEILEGQSLEERVANGRSLTEREFLAVADAVLDVLDAAHANGVVHRDIKPENIFIARDESGGERIKVLDFGLARLLEGHSTTTHGIALGTPSFMSPEQAAGLNHEVDGRTDLFALAASGFRLISGRKIHEGQNPIELMGKMASLPAPRLQTVAPTVTDAFARVIDRGLAFLREDRYESASAMRADVERAIATLDAGTTATVRLLDPIVEKSLELSTADFEHAVAPATVADPGSRPTVQLPRPRFAEAIVEATPPLPQPPAEKVDAPAATVRPGQPVEPLAKTIAGGSVPHERPVPPVGSPSAGAASSLAEDSLAAIPMQRPRYALPLVVGLLVVALGTAAFMTLTRNTSDDVAANVHDAAASELDGRTHDAEPEAAESAPALADSSVVVNPPRPRVAPARSPNKPPGTKPTKHPRPH